MLKKHIVLLSIFILLLYFFSFSAFLLRLLNSQFSLFFYQSRDYRSSLCSLFKVRGDGDTSAVPDDAGDVDVLVRV